MRPLAIVLFMMLVVPVAPDANAAPKTGSGTGLTYECDSKKNRCTCKGYFDCRKMEETECDGGFQCKPGTANCCCRWKKGRWDVCKNYLQPRSRLPKSTRDAPASDQQKLAPTRRDHRKGAPTRRDYRLKK